MTASTPQELQTRFLELFLNNDLDGLLSLYEDTAVFVLQGGESAVGTAGIREALSGLLGIAQKFDLVPSFAVEVDGVALMHGNWSLEGVDPAGNPLSMGGTTIEVARRQVDGSWLYSVDSPFGVIA
ncbi:MAG TPA: nuclear transport factor 2 family protein [Pseudonocardiaceae bacterium]|nr:nuclear transport factor 2 family protein [Pseudonocardiaceae bacterium]